jgi:orotate phosphoribosyltransferase-like protein
MRPGDILSRIFDKPLAIMSTSSYRAEAGTVQGHLDIAHYITTPKGEIAGKVLLVDDLADSGHTLHKVVDMLRSNYKKITELRTAVIWTKGLSKFTAGLLGGVPADQSVDPPALRELRLHAFALELLLRQQVEGVVVGIAFL